MKNKANKGFTLFELLVSISIIGILVALVSVSFSAAQKKARDAKRMQDMEAVGKAAEQYYSLAGYVYPANTTMPWLVNGNQILQVFPSDPKAAPYTQYSYAPGALNASFCACALMENTTAGNSGAACTFGTATTYYCVKNQQ